eukprot:GFYU01000290.1.p1 GENE.GFYU01000290.1~~GFYU01000290.1.p1  ORF type:complete len:284 (-),score=86.65 GFYU01000290.1:107-958(-)
MKAATAPVVKPDPGAERLKEDGNKLFVAKEYEKAVEYYTEAIILDSRIATYYTNRALCYLNLEQWDLVRKDCEKAIKLDNKNVKGYYMLGKAMTEKGDFEGLKHLEKAVDLSKLSAKPSPTYTNDIIKEMRRAKKKQWEKRHAQRVEEMMQMKHHVEQAMAEYLTKLTAQAETEEVRQDTVSNHEDYMKLFHSLVDKEVNPGGHAEPPEYLNCEIGMDVVRDPCITPAGITYERTTILEHLRKVGEFEPVTRKPLHAGQLVPNLAIRDAAEHFLEKNPWAFSE